MPQAVCVTRCVVPQAVCVTRCVVPQAVCVTRYVVPQVMCETMNSHMVEIDSPMEEQFIMQRVYFIERECPRQGGD